MTVLLSNPVWRKASWLTALALTASAVLLHFFSQTQVGGLWRDEIAIINIARLPSWLETFQRLPHDHCPIVFPAVVKFWTALGWGQTDAGLRMLGLAIGLLVVTSYWTASQLMGRQPPLVFLALVAVNPVVIRYTETIRGYALGIALIVLTMGLIWRYIETPNLGRGLLAGLGALLSVQTLYQNAFFLLAIGLAGMGVCFRQNQRAKALGILAIGLVAALSMLPYVRPVLQAQEWWIVVSQTGTSLGIAWRHLARLTGVFLGAWMIGLVLAAGFGLSRLLPGRQPASDRDRPDLALFGGISLILGIIGFGVFLRLTGLPTQLWYYIPGLCFAAVCCDAVVSRAHPIARMAVLVLAVAALLVSVSPAAFAALRWRQTNADLVAAQVAKDSDAGDLIIVHPWYFGLTYDFYYRGAAKWTTLPPLADYRFHRYDLLKEKLATTNAIAPVMAQLEATLRSGHRVWIVGNISAPPAGAPPPRDPPVAPHGPLGWSDYPYTEAWGNEVGYFLEQHVTQATLVINPATNAIPINSNERVTLVVANGWRDSTPTNSP
ncbi:MAG TPA: hypothetical protein VMB80_02770 [Candidatus Acidoferrum sp.]|nr:hypothetical protein [Candidatus Acidoferrum sp.]